MLLINLFGVPSAGKSTGAAYIFSKLKMAGINCELVTEFAKDKVWEQSKEVFNNQVYIFGKQFFKISRVQEKVDVIVTDSPLLLSAFYNNSELLGEEYNELVAKIAKSYDSLNFLLLRDKPYNPQGRFQTEEQSDAMEKPMRDLLEKYRIDYFACKGNQDSYDEIVKLTLNELNPNKYPFSIDVFRHLYLKRMKQE